MKAILISPNAELRGALEKAAGCYSILGITKSLDTYPDDALFRHLVKVWAPDVVFISMENAEAAGRISKQMDAEFASMQRVALSMAEDPSVFRFALHLRMAELLVPPFNEDQLQATLVRLAEHLAIHPASTGTLGKVYAFVPSKGGVGASTIAANAARAFAQAPASKVLLADFDISSGMLGFGFNAEHDYSINDAAKRNKELDEETWQRLVKKAGSVDLLLSGAPIMDEGIAAQQIPPVLDFARRTYSVIGVDLSDTFDERALVVMREANEIFLVTTPDLGALRMARLKILALRRHEWEDKTRLLLNRVTKRMELSVDEVEATVGLPVYATFPCEYADITCSIRKAEASSKLAPSIKRFVEKLGDTKITKKKRSRFIERFALVPARYGFN
jgi:pilus assembly protein CpaE